MYSVGVFKEPPSIASFYGTNVNSNLMWTWIKKLHQQKMIGYLRSLSIDCQIWDRFTFKAMIPENVLMSMGLNYERIEKLAKKLHYSQKDISMLYSTIQTNDYLEDLFATVQSSQSSA